jgi:hypothetical protein
MKQKLELFSPINEGELVNEATYLKQILTFAQQEWKGITMTDPLIRKVWSKVKAGTYFDDSPADEVAQLYEKMDEDYSAAKELVETYEEPVIGNDNQPEVSEESQEKLELVQSVTEGLELSSFTQKFDLGSGMTQCVPKGKVDAKDWVKAFAFGLTLESGSQWIIGDAVVALEDGGHDDVVNQLCAQFKKSYSTVSGYARTSRNFQHEKRDPMLPFTVYREIGNADLSDKKKLALLDAAKEEKLSSQEVRGKVREAQGKEEAQRPLRHRYLVFSKNNPNIIRVTRSMPQKIEENQVVIDGHLWAMFNADESDWINIVRED